MNKEDKTIDKNDVENKSIIQISRRRFCQLAGATVAAIALGRYVGFDPASPAAAYPVSPGLTKFTETLRGVGPGGIPVALPDLIPAPGTGAVHYTLKIGQYTDTLHSSLGLTSLWGYSPARALGEGAYPTRHLGGIIVAEKGVPIQLTFENNLPATHILPVDPSIIGVVAGHHNRACVHLHGGLVPWVSDGGPFSWFGNTVDGDYGPSVLPGPYSEAGTQRNIYKNLNMGLLPGQAEYYYPNNQSARFIWYHDHAIGLTRLNAYAGIASAYIIRDNFERSLRDTKGLPAFVENGGNEIPIVLQDKIFKTDGNLDYPSLYEDRWASWGGADLTGLGTSVVPEMFGDTMLVNGVVHPKAAVEPRRYRLRILDACAARFLNLQVYEDNGSGMPDFNSPGPNFLVIGTEGGFLANPVLIPSNNPIVYSPGTNDVADVANPAGAGKLTLLTAPGERWDVIVDFGEKDHSGNYKFAGKSFILYNDAPAPFPGGEPLNDLNNAGNGLNTRNIMRFDVASSITGSSDLGLGITTSTDLRPGIDPFLNPSNAVRTRHLTLNEVFDEHGRLIQMLGTNMPTDLPTGYHSDPTFDENNYARGYEDMVDTANPITEKPVAGDIEIWEIANLTMDTHPMHFHLVNVKVLKRQAMVIDPDTLTYEYTNGVPNYGTNPARDPEPTELGWKETVKMNPGEVTTIIMKFDLPTVPVEVPQSPRTGGHEYVWHCHILEHEEHDMMRPLVVLGGPTPPPPVPELPTAILTAVGTVAALALAGKMKNENKDDDKK